MNNGFNFSLYGRLFKNCFIEYSTYRNGDLQLSIFGMDTTTKEIAHLTDITLEQNCVNLGNNEVVVNNRFKPTLVPQLENLGILKEKLRMCIVNDVFYPIYSIDLSKLNENRYYLYDMVAA